MKLKGSKALVTGASRGIGRAIAVALLEQGAEVWGTSRNPEAVEWPKGIKPIALDISSLDTIEEAWRTQGLGEIEFDLVVNNAGDGAFGAFEEQSFKLWSEQINVLLQGPIKISHLAMRKLKEREGVLVNVSSMAAEFPIPYMSSYNAAKAGLSAFSESLLMESNGVRVIDFRPGDIKTDFNDRMKSRGDTATDPKQSKVWQVIEARLSNSPLPEKAARDLLRALRKDRIGVVTSGSWFQARFSAFFTRFLSKSAKRACVKRYYKL